MAIRYGSDVPPAPERLERARAVLREASERVGAQVAEEAFKEAAVHGQAFVQGDRVLKSEEVLAPTTIAKQAAESAASGKFDRAAYQKAYMKTYMQAYRARRKLSDK